MHAVMDALAGPRGTERCNRGLEIDDPDPGTHPFHPCEGIAPDKAEIDRSGDGAAAALGEAHIVQGVPWTAFMEGGIARMRQDLVDSARGLDPAVSTAYWAYGNTEGTLIVVLVGPGAWMPFLFVHGLSALGFAGMNIFHDAFLVEKRNAEGGNARQVVPDRAGSNRIIPQKQWKNLR